MNFRFQVSGSRFQAPDSRRGGRARRFLGAFLLLLCATQFASRTVSAQNDLQKTADGGFFEKWLISNEFPAEIDAGLWENFNRFNIETLPRKDWLAPFGGIQNVKPQPGTFKATFKTDENPQSQIQNPKLRADLPEVGEVSNAKPLPDATEIAWRETNLPNSLIDFFNLNGAKSVGTAYAAAYIDAAKDEIRFIETDGFLGAVWLNGEKIYDGFSLNLKKIAAAKFKAGKNLLIVRGTGVSGDYWRKNGGWAATLKIWRTEKAANDSAAFKPSGAPGTIFYLEGFHVDPVYLQDQRGYAKVTLSNTNQYVQSLRADPRYGVFLSEIDYLKPYLDTHPEDRDFLRRTVAEGRVGTGGAYNQFNELNIGGEAMIRNILYGQAMHEAMLGKKSKSLALWDVFGHAPQLSQIAAKAGFTGVVWSKKITGFEPLFYDYALDGSRLLHRRVDYAYSFSGFGSGKNYSLDNFRRMTERKFEETKSFGSNFDLRINAADFTPPWTNLAGNVEKLETQRPQIRVTGQAQDLFFDAVNEEIKLGKFAPPVTSRDKLFFHVGVMMARSDLKVAHRHTENITLTAEKFGTIAYLRGAKYPDLALDKAWRQIFFGSHHDAITGTPSDSALLDLVHGYREAFELSKNALDDSLKFIAKQINTKPDSKFQTSNSRLIPIVVFNPMNWTRSDNVKAKVEFPESVKDFLLFDENGKKVEFRKFKGLLELPKNRSTFEGGKFISREPTGGGLKTSEFEFVAENIPSIGYKTYFVVPTENYNDEKNIKNSTTAIENEFYKITVDAEKGGAVSSIFDKQANREIVNTTNGNFGNEIAALKEELTRKNVIYPAWELWTTGEKKLSTEKPAQVLPRQFNDAQTLTITGELPNMQKFVQTISLHKGVKRIDFKTELVGYKGKDELFVVNFPLNLTGGALVTEDRFGTVVRNGSKGFLDFKTNTDKLVSGAPVYGVNNWAEYGSTFNLNFVGQSANVAASVPLKPTALVRPHGATYEKATEMIVANFIKRGVSVTPFYDDNDAKRRKNLMIEDSTMPKNLNDDIAYHGFRIALGGEKENLYSAKLLQQVSAETRGAFELRLQHDGFAFLFLYDKEIPEGWKPLPTLLIAGDAEKAIANLLPIGERQQFALNLPFETFAAETNPNKDLPKVPDYGVALINNGTPAVSLENPDTLTLHLTHTALFPGVNLPFEFVPENKTHVFEYALYPHEKDWREADTVKVGYDFNNPLIAVQTDVHDGELPSENSFLQLQSQADNIVLSALKLGGNQQAHFQTNSNNSPRPFVMRFYETDGLKTNGNLITNFTNAESVEDFVQSFENVNLLEEPIKNTARKERNWRTRNSFFLRFEPNGIETYKVITKEIVMKNDTSLQTMGVTKEITQPVFSRYWLHNAGAAPIGNDAVKVSLRSVEQMGNLSTFSWDDPYNQGGITTVAVRVQIVNNYQDRQISGEVALEIPEDWRVVPDKIAYEIEPNGSFVKDVIITAFPVKKNLEFERASGLIKARIEHDGQIFQDVLNLGKLFKLEWRTEKTADGVLVYVKNPHRQAIEGAVALVEPYETWLFAEPSAPRELGFTVPPRGEIVLKFSQDDSDANAWAIARIAYNGSVEYLRADNFAVVPVKK